MTAQNRLFLNRSPEILRACEILGEFLAEKVTKQDQWLLEQNCFADEILDLSVDFRIKTPDKLFAYKIIEPNISSPRLATISFSSGKTDCYLHFLFLSQIFEARNQEGLFSLSDAEVKLVRQQKFDVSVFEGEKFLGSLFYIDILKEELIILRRLLSSGQLYHGERVTTVLKQALIAPDSGELSSKGEYENFKEVKSKRKFVGKIVEEAKALNKSIQGNYERSKHWVDWQGRQTPYVENAQSMPKYYVCKVCLKLTNDWVSCDNDSMACICKGCQLNIHQET